MSKKTGSTSETDLGHDAEAQSFLVQALQIREKTLGQMHPDVAQSLNNLAALYLEQGKYTEAEPLFQRALIIVESVLGSEHIHVGTCLNNLETLDQSQGKYSEAEPLFSGSS